ncbi:MAG TPA: tRNA (adenosine(37)-N6)-threonylcarbamoyltransferase complex dimerization subunit type 1 TsaB [Syntrophobacteraceae bacterium]|nr:tRNA (adenosine(37)-N6)-threonylcarbamoyltransferase complex dimerization subunit type 1 TsaB [Syntrophobacteraceae bacterium]
MKILAADTSTISGSLALFEDEDLRGECTFSSSKTHNRRLLKSIDWLLGEAGWELESIDAFAVTGGPGSFTGLRIGMTTIKVLAWTRGKLFASICSLDALALPLSFSASPICTLLDARKGEVYCALYRPDGKGGLNRETDYAAMSPSRLAQSLTANLTGPVIFCGDGWTAYRNTLRKKLPRLVLEPPSSFHVIRAASVAELARRRFAKGQSDDPRSSAPLYIRPSEAEIHYPHLAEKSSERPEFV